MMSIPLSWGWHHVVSEIKLRPILESKSWFMSPFPYHNVHTLLTDFSPFNSMSSRSLSLDFELELEACSSIQLDVYECTQVSILFSSRPALFFHQTCVNKHRLYDVTDTTHRCCNASNVCVECQRSSRDSFSSGFCMSCSVEGGSRFSWKWMHPYWSWVSASRWSGLWAVVLREYFPADGIILTSHGVDVGRTHRALYFCQRLWYSPRSSVVDFILFSFTCYHAKPDAILVCLFLTFTASIADELRLLDPDFS